MSLSSQFPPFDLQYLLFSLVETVSDWTAASRAVPDIPTHEELVSGSSTVGSGGGGGGVAFVAELCRGVSRFDGVHGDFPLVL